MTTPGDTQGHNENHTTRTTLWKVVVVGGEGAGEEEGGRGREGGGGEGWCWRMSLSINANACTSLGSQTPGDPATLGLDVLLDGDRKIPVNGQKTPPRLHEQVDELIWGPSSCPGDCRNNPATWNPCRWPAQQGHRPPWQSGETAEAPQFSALSRPPLVGFFRHVETTLLKNCTSGTTRSSAQLCTVWRKCVLQVLAHQYHQTKPKEIPLVLLRAKSNKQANHGHENTKEAILALQKKKRLRSARLWAPKQYKQSTPSQSDGTCGALRQSCWLPRTRQCWQGRTHTREHVWTISGKVRTWSSAGEKGKNRPPVKPSIALKEELPSRRKWTRAP